MPLLDGTTIQEAHAAVITARLERSALLAALSPQVASSLPTLSTPSQQLWSDLNVLSRWPLAADGAVPLLQWLDAAATLARSLPEGAVLAGAARQVRAALPGGASTPEPLAIEPLAKPARDAGHVLGVVVAAPADERFVGLVERHLAPLLRGGGLALWHRGKVLPGMPTAAADAIERADFALAFFSADALSDPATHADIEALAAARAARGLRVVPVVARPSDWTSTPLGTLQPLPRDGRALSLQRDADEACVEIARAVRAIVEDLGGRKRAAAPAAADVRGDPLASGAPAPAAQVAPAAAQQVARAGAAPIAPPLEYPWSQPSAVTLRDLLVGAYGAVDRAAHIAKRGEVGLGNVPLGGAIEPAWNGILEASARQGALGSLLRATLADREVRGYWPSIRTCALDLGVSIDAAGA